MSGSTAKHLGNNPAPRRTGSLAVHIALACAASLAGAILLEAGTIFGSFLHRVGDLSAWMPKRMVVFFCLLLPICVLAARRLGANTCSARHGARRLPPSDLAKRAALVVAPATVAAVAGVALGVLVAQLQGNPADPRYGMALAGALAAIALVAANARVCLRSLEWAYLALALSFGTVFCLCMPAAAEISWDGHIHFNSANALSFLFDAEYTGADALMTIGGEQVGTLAQTGGDGEVEELEVELGGRTVPFPHADLTLVVVTASNEALQAAEDTADILRCSDTATALGGSYLSASSVGHLPNAAGLWLGRFLHLGCVGRYTLARLCNLWFYAIVFFFAIRALKGGKAIMAAIGLCPTALFEAANFSYDPWSICLLSLSVALFVGKLQRNGDLAPKDMLACLVPFVLGALVRAVLFPLAIVFALAPKRRFASTRSWAASLALVLGAVLMLLGSFALPYFVSLSGGAQGGDSRGGSSVSVAGQISYVLAHPVETLRTSAVFAVRMLNPLNLGFALDASDENLLYYFPYLIPTNAPLTEVLAPAEFLLLLGVSLTDGDQDDEAFSSVRYKVGPLVATGLCFALVSGSMYAAFTEVGRDTIVGVQQRYLLGLLAAFFLFVLNVALRRRGPHTWLAPAFIVVELVLLSLVAWNSFVWAF